MKDIEALYQQLALLLAKEFTAEEIDCLRSCLDTEDFFEICDNAVEYKEKVKI